MITASGPADSLGAEALSGAARAAAAAHGGGGDTAALAVRLLADDASHRMALLTDGRLDLTVDRDGTELILRLHDTGEPVTGPPAAVLALVDLGLASAADGGVSGDGNLVEVRIPLPSHGRLLDDTGLEILDEDTPLTDAAVEFRELRVEDAPALTRCLYRCYGWTYPNPDLYFPDRIAAAIESGRRFGQVAVDDTGEIAAHFGAVFMTEGVIEAGAAVTDPRFRRRGLIGDLRERLAAQSRALGVRGRVGEPVLTHPATQLLSLRGGSTMVGLHLNVTLPLQQVAITDGLTPSRLSLTVMYQPIEPLSPATIWIPALYESLIRSVLDRSSWPREIGEFRGTVDCPERSVLGSSYDSLNRAGSIEVREIGHDLVDVLDDALHHLRSAGADVVQVRVPTSQPAFAGLGAGLGALGLSYASFIPEFGPMGDVLTLQWLRDREVDDSEWVYADDTVRDFAHLVMDQVRRLGDEATSRRRREARRQQLFAALPLETD